MTSISKATLGLVVLLAAVLGFCPPSPVQYRRLAVVVIDSQSSLTAEAREVLRVFPTLTHGGLVRDVIYHYGGNPDEFVMHDVGEGGGRAGIQGYLAALRKTVSYAKNHPGQPLVVNISLGHPYPDAAEQGLIDSLLEQGALVVAAAGNEGSERVRFPAGYDGVIAVAEAKAGTWPDTRTTASTWRLLRTDPFRQCRRGTSGFAHTQGRST